MASLSGEKTLAELSAEFGVHPTMISNWKQELVKRAGELFARGSTAPVKDAQKVGVDLVLGMLLAGVSLRPDRPKSELSHQPPDTPTTDRDPLPQQRHLKPAAAVDGMPGKNPIEPLQSLEFLSGFRLWPIIEAAARDPE